VQTWRKLPDLLHQLRNIGALVVGRDEDNGSHFQKHLLLENINQRLVVCAINVD
jgi:hypothetical protein